MKIMLLYRLFRYSFVCMDLSFNYNCTFLEGQTIRLFLKLIVLDFKSQLVVIQSSECLMCYFGRLNIYTYIYNSCRSAADGRSSEFVPLVLVITHCRPRFHIFSGFSPAGYRPLIQKHS